MIVDKTPNKNGFQIVFTETTVSLFKLYSLKPLSVFSGQSREGGEHSWKFWRGMLVSRFFLSTPKNDRREILVAKNNVIMFRPPKNNVIFLLSSCEISIYCSPLFVHPPPPQKKKEKIMLINFQSPQKK